MRYILTILGAFALAFTMNVGDASASFKKLKKRSDKNCGNLMQCLFGEGAGFNFSSTRSTVNYPQGKKYRPGTIIISTPQRALYYVLKGGKAIRYKVGVGRQGFQWSGTSRINRKAKWPTWTPPAAMRAREKKRGRILPVSMPGGVNNPLGARALYIAGTIYRIHGTNNKSSIGLAMSSGCIRMMNHDVIDLYKRVKIGSRVIVRQ